MYRNLEIHTIAELAASDNPLEWKKCCTMFMSITLSLKHTLSLSSPLSHTNRLYYINCEWNCGWKWAGWLKHWAKEIWYQKERQKETGRWVRQWNMTNLDVPMYQLSLQMCTLGGCKNIVSKHFAALLLCFPFYWWKVVYMFTLYSHAPLLPIMRTCIDAAIVHDKSNLTVCVRVCMEPVPKHTSGPVIKPMANSGCF